MAIEFKQVIDEVLHTLDKRVSVWQSEKMPIETVELEIKTIFCEAFKKIKEKDISSFYRNIALNFHTDKLKHLSSAPPHSQGDAFLIYCKNNNLINRPLNILIDIKTSLEKLPQDNELVLKLYNFLNWLIPIRRSTHSYSPSQLRLIEGLKLPNLFDTLSNLVIYCIASILLLGPLFLTGLTVISTLGRWIVGFGAELATQGEYQKQLDEYELNQVDFSKLKKKYLTLTRIQEVFLANQNNGKEEAQSFVLMDEEHFMEHLRKEAVLKIFKTNSDLLAALQKERAEYEAEYERFRTAYFKMPPLDGSTLISQAMVRDKQLKLQNIDRQITTLRNTINLFETSDVEKNAQIDKYLTDSIDGIKFYSLRRGSGALRLIGKLFFQALTAPLPTNFLKKIPSLLSRAVLGFPLLFLLAAEICLETLISLSIFLTKVNLVILIPFLNLSSLLADLPFFVVDVFNSIYEKGILKSLLNAGVSFKGFFARTLDDLKAGWYLINTLSMSIDKDHAKSTKATSHATILAILPAPVQNITAEVENTPDAVPRTALQVKAPAPATNEESTGSDSMDYTPPSLDYNIPSLRA